MNYLIHSKIQAYLGHSVSPVPINFDIVWYIGISLCVISTFVLILKFFMDQPSKQPPKPASKPARKKVCWRCSGKGYNLNEKRKRIPCPYCNKGWEYQDFADGNGGDLSKHPDLGKSSGGGKSSVEGKSSVGGK